METVWATRAVALWGASAGLAVACETTVVHTANGIGFDGCISQQSVALFVSKATPNVGTLVIRSEGGDVRAAIAMAEEVRRRGMQIRIRGYCNSSCANYLLPVAVAVVAEQGARVVLHGDARSTRTRVDGRDYFDPMLVVMLDQMSVSEENLARSSPMVDVVHAAQTIASAPLGASVTVALGGTKKVCVGLGQLPWAPSLQVLRAIKLIGDVVAPNPALLPELPSREASWLPDETGDTNPFDSCK
jgi:hypothetical protein